MMQGICTLAYANKTKNWILACFTSEDLRVF